MIAGYLLVVALSRITATPAVPPGSRASGWRADFTDESPGQEERGLRLVPRGPITAHYDDQKAA